MNRRQFLMSSAMVTAGAVAVAQSEKGKMPCAVIGLGHAHALDIVEVLKASGDFELRAVCEPDAAVRAEVESTPALRGVAWASRDEILNDADITMAAIESLVPQLLDHAHAAADAGKHIHLDKPAGISLPPFEALVDKMTRRGLLLQMGYMYRYNAGFDFVRRAVREGMLGDVYRVNGIIDTDYTREKRDKLSGRPGGLMFELGCHLLDITMLMLGEPNKVTPVLRHDAKENDDLLDNTAAVFEFDRAFAVIESSAMRAGAFATRRYEIVGANGSIVVEPHEPPAVVLTLREARAEFKKGTQKIPVEDHPRHVADFQDLARCIRGESKYAYTKQHDIGVQRALLQAAGL